MKLHEEWSGATPECVWGSNTEVCVCRHLSSERQVPLITHLFYTSLF